MSTGYKRDHEQRNQMLMPFALTDTISTGDAAAIAQCSIATIRRLVKDGTIKAHPISGRPGSPYRVLRRSLENYLVKLLDEHGLQAYSASPASAASPAASVAGTRK